MTGNWWPYQIVPPEGESGGGRSLVSATRDLNQVNWLGRLLAISFGLRNTDTLSADWTQSNLDERKSRPSRRSSSPRSLRWFDFWCFFREVLLTFSNSLATHDSNWISYSFSGNKHV